MLVETNPCFTTAPDSSKSEVVIEPRKGVFPVRLTSVKITSCPFSLTLVLIPEISMPVVTVPFL